MPNTDVTAETAPSQAWVSPSSKGGGAHQSNAQGTGGPVWCYQEAHSVVRVCSLVLGGREDFPGKGSRKERSQPIREGHQHDWASGREALMCLKMRNRGFPAVQWWGHRASPAGGVCSIPGEGTKILKAARCGPTKKRWERKSLWLMGAHGDNSPGWLAQPGAGWASLSASSASPPGCSSLLTPWTWVRLLTWCWLSTRPTEVAKLFMT